MFHRSFVAAWLLVCFAVVLPQAVGQSTEVGKRCNLSVFGEKNTDGFFTFDRDFRDAIENEDAGRLALLTQFPLMVNDERGTILIPDAKSFQGHFADVFTPAIRHIILTATRETIWCNYTGISYGNGDLWINVTDQGFFLMTINSPDALPSVSSKDRSIDLACHTKDRRVLIDSTPKGVPRLRTWSFAHSLSRPPDLEIAAGKDEWGGTGPCAGQTWTFHSGNSTITVDSANGCWPDDNQPPHNAQAQITVTDATGKQESSNWCF